MTAITIQRESSHPTVTASSSAALLTVRTLDLCKRIDERAVLSDINLEVQPGNYLALLGANGAGKTTLLHVLATLTPATSGQLYLFGQKVSRADSALRAGIGMIGHQPMLYRDLSALENLIFFGKLYDLAQPRQRAMQLLEQVDLIDRASDPVSTFSRGMVQRLSIARALMHDPTLILADEPFSGLDVPSVRTLEEQLQQLHEAGKTIILVNHDVNQSLRIARHVVVLRRGHLVVDQPVQDTSLRTVMREVMTP